MEQNKFDPLQFIGFLLISAILMFWFYDNQSSMIENQQINDTENLVEETYADSNQTENSSSNNIKIDQKFEEEIISLENENILFEISTSGAEIKKILLKNFSNYDEEPLYLVDNNKSIFSYDIPIGRNSVINSADLNYTYQVIKPGSEIILSGIIDEQKSLDLTFKLDKDSSIVDFLIKLNDSNRSNNYESVQLIWGRDSFRNSKSIDYENRYTSLAYGFEEKKDSYLSVGGSTNKNINSVNWISFREHFFSSILILKNQVNDVFISSEDLAGNVTLDNKFTKRFLANVPLNLDSDDSLGFSMYFGPTDYDSVEKRKPR
jgi:YidC/Oxa1 family membrane protein insertase